MLVQGLGSTARHFFARAFRERQIFVRADGRVRFHTVSRASQLGFLTVATALFWWSIHATVAYFSYDARIAASHDKLAEVNAAFERLINERNKAVEKAQLAYRDILEGSLGHREGSASANDMLKEKQTQLAALEQHNIDLARQLASLVGELKASQAERDRLISNVDDLTRQRSALDAQLLTTKRQNGELDGRVVSLNDRLATMSVAHGQAEAERAAADQHVAELQQQIAKLQSDQKLIISRLSERAASGNSKVEHMIAMTGLDVNRLLAVAHKDAVLNAPGRNASGGPFVALKPGKTASSSQASLHSSELEGIVSALDSQEERRESLRQVLEHLPLATPLDGYHVASEFGPRIDPINGRLAMHQGVDLVSELHAPVMATAPGKVDFAGWFGSYGKMVEIDHGMGIKTRYAHLSSISVQVGRRVATHTQIGVIGNTGRSTGTHVHYEVLVDGRPQNPIKFLKAGEYVLSKD